MNIRFRRTGETKNINFAEWNFEDAHEIMKLLSEKELKQAFIDIVSELRQKLDNMDFEDYINYITHTDAENRLSEILNKRLDTIFSSGDGGAEGYLILKKPQKLIIACQICIEEYEVYSEIKIPFYKLIKEYMEDSDIGDEEVIIKELQSIIDDIKKKNIR